MIENGQLDIQIVFMTPDFENGYSVVFDTGVRERVPSCHTSSIAATADAQEDDDGAARGVTVGREPAAIVHTRAPARPSNGWRYLLHADRNGDNEEYQFPGARRAEAA